MTKTTMDLQHILADLTRADLTRADLTGFRQDMIAEILKLPAELDDLRTAIVGGQIDGSTYNGECACLAGTLAKIHGFEGEYVGQPIGKFVADSHSPRECWFMMIKPGDTPDTNQASKLALEWLDEAIAIRDNIRGLAIEARRETGE